MGNLKGKKQINFQGDCKIIRTLDSNIIALAKYLSQIKGESCINNLHFIIPSNVTSLPIQIMKETINLELLEIEQEI
jgi:hypothetical protein